MSDQSNVTQIRTEDDFFVNPRKFTRIAVPAIGGWVEVRDEISIGEERGVFGKAVKGNVHTPDGGQRMEYDAEKVSFGMTYLHIVDWSLKRKFDFDALKGLKPEFFKAIDDAVQKHIKEMAEKNAPTTRSSSESQTSGSAV